MKRNSKKLSKIERTAEKKRVTEYKQHGDGVYIYKNRNQNASLELPKPSNDGRKWIGPNETWEGDSYFMHMIPKEAVLVETVLEPQKKEIKMEDKLILDQPDQVTKTGKVEHKVASDLPINENSPKEDEVNDEKLLTEDPLSGVTIIRD